MRDAGGSRPGGGRDILLFPQGRRTGREERGMIETRGDGWREAGRGVKKMEK